MRNYSALGFVSAFQHAVLLGDPGGGKSTFANMLAHSLACEWLIDRKESGLKRLGADWQAGALLPVRVIVREFAAAKPDPKAESPAEDLWNFILRQIPNPIRAQLAPKLENHLFNEGGIFILDGYDEAPETAEHRQRVKDAVIGLKAMFPKARILLTSRVYAYQFRDEGQPDEVDWRLTGEGFEDATLARFTPEQQQKFVDLWYGYCAEARPAQFPGNKGKTQADDLKQLLKSREDLKPLAERPLLLTLMASLHAWRHGELPDDREGLYNESVDLLLRTWQNSKHADGVDDPSEDVIRKIQPPGKLNAALEKLAFNAHANQEKSKIKGVADIPQKDLAEALLAVSSKQINFDQVVAYIHERAGLLSDNGRGVHRFPHRTFQEYLAARHLTNHDFKNTAVRLIREDVERWREVFLLAGAKAIKGNAEVGWELVRLLIDDIRRDGGGTDLKSAGGRPASGSGEDGLQIHPTETDWTCLALAGQLLAETRLYERLPDGGLNASLDKTPDEIRDLLGQLLDTGQLEPKARAEAGWWLGKIGDRRFGVSKATEIDWITIQPPEQGWFWMGEKQKWHGEARIKCRWVEKPFKIARYPVTVAQFQEFLVNTGTEARQLPTGFEGRNQPRVNVSWREAMEFCAWLSEKTGETVTLPNEFEWEFAARGEDGREYPWKGDWKPDAANVSETGIGKTSAVGMFPEGESWCGARDLAGNVLEWTRTAWREKHLPKTPPADHETGSDNSSVIRGGAWLDDPDGARCAYRPGVQPVDRYSLLGFRVCVSPFEI